MSEEKRVLYGTSEKKRTRHGKRRNRQSIGSSLEKAPFQRGEGLIYIPLVAVAVLVGLATSVPAATTATAAPSVAASASAATAARLRVLHELVR